MKRHDLDAVTVNSMSFRHRRNAVLRDCSFTLPAGRVAGLLGVNGAGKSTLLALTTGLLQPTSGTINVLGTSPGKAAVSRVALLAQHRPLYPELTVGETLRWGASLNPHWDATIAQGLVDQGGLVRDRRVHLLTPGQRALLATALVLGKRADLILLDEPFTALDPVAREYVIAALMTYVADTGATVLLSTHALADITDVCDHVIVLTGGRPVLTGDVEDILTQHAILTTLAGQADPWAPHQVIEQMVTERQASALVRTTGVMDTSRWNTQPASIEQVALAYLRTPQG